MCRNCLWVRNFGFNSRGLSLKQGTGNPKTKFIESKRLANRYISLYFILNSCCTMKIAKKLQGKSAKRKKVKKLREIMAEDENLDNKIAFMIRHNLQSIVIDPFDQPTECAIFESTTHGTYIGIQNIRIPSFV